MAKTIRISDEAHAELVKRSETQRRTLMAEFDVALGVPANGGRPEGEGKTVVKGRSVGPSLPVRPVPPAGTEEEVSPEVACRRCGHPKGKHLGRGCLAGCTCSPERFR